ncbi:MAG TPA: D-alanyl-D-alanine carboxypeptidase [Mycobacteriales bacterium]|nr:D-alanyl-D-alanine carboxypeptidase [Mycobacteriales bacterium]
MPRFPRCAGSALVLLTAVAGLLGVAPTAASAGSAQADLDARIRAALRGSTARTVASYVLVDGLGTVAAANPHAALPPASNEKMYGGLAALLSADPNRRLRTEIRHTGTITDGVIEGDLVLKAGGDPTLKSAHLTAFAQQLAAQGISAVTGALWADDTRYDRDRRVAGWEPDDVPEELGPLSAFVVDRNTWRKDAAYVADPVPGNLAKFRSALAVAGVRVVGPDLVGQPTSPVVDAEPLALHESPQVAWLVMKSLKNSDNFYAEMLLKELGAEAGAGTTAEGANAVRRLGATLGVDLRGFVDGSGLSAHDRQTAVGAVTWLRRAQNTAAGPAFRTSLAIGCRDGTLADRFCGTPASGRVSAKTGTLKGVRTLSGYTVTRSNRKVWFSFMLVGASNGTEARRAIDRAVVAIAGFSS